MKKNWINYSLCMSFLYIVSEKKKDGSSMKECIPKWNG